MSGCESDHLKNMTELLLPLAQETRLPVRDALRPGAHRNRRRSNGDANRLDPTDRPAHGWYRFVLSFPPHLVRDYLHRFDADSKTVCFDPFCGTGTTLVECKKLGIASIGVEAHPMSFFAAATKTDWAADPERLLAHAEGVAQRALEQFNSDGISDAPGNVPSRVRLRRLPAETASLLLDNSISALPLHKTLVLLEKLRECSGSEYHRHELLALAQALVSTVGNLHFGPEVGVGPPKMDVAVIARWLEQIRTIASDLRHLRSQWQTKASVIRADSRDLAGLIEPQSVDVVITSPPYPNEKDYTRTTRLESVLLGLLQTKQELRAIKQFLMRSNTRNVYKGDDDHFWIANHPEIHRIADAIERRRISLGKTSGFERMYAAVTKLYFGGMAKHLHQLKAILRPGAKLAYVVGDQASYLRVMIRTGQILADVARAQGYEVRGMDLFRTRFSTATGEQLREEVVLLRWPG